MSFSSEKSSRQTSSSLPRQDTATTVSSLSTSCSNLETNETTLSTSSASTSTTKKRCQKSKSKRKSRRHSVENFVPTSDPKTLKTLKVHYYPEEQSWCLVIVLVATIVQTINHGLHLAFGLFLVTLTHSFNRVSFISAGERFLFHIFAYTQLTSRIYYYASDSERGVYIVQIKSH